MKFHSQGLPRYVVQRTYWKNEQSFKDTARYVPISSIPSNANVKFSQVIYIVMLLDNKSLQIKILIVPHENK